MADAPKPRPRVLKWLKQLEEAGFDDAKAKAALNAIRDDAEADAKDREHFYRALAQQSYVHYLGVLRGKPLNEDEILEHAEAAQAARKSEG